MNRPPGPTDRWWAEHQQKCGGVYTKIKSPPEFLRKEEAKKKREEKKRARASPSVKEFFTASGDVPKSTSKTEAAAAGISEGKKKQKVPVAKGTAKEPKKIIKKPKTSDPGPLKPAAEIPPNTATPAGITAGLLFPVVVATGTNGEEELLLVGDINVVFGSTHAGVGNFSAPAPRSGGVVDLTFSDSDSEEKPPIATLATPANASRNISPSSSAKPPEIIELD